MNYPARKSRIIKNFLLLFAVVLLTAIITWLVGLFYKLNPTYSAEGPGWGAIGDAMSVGFIGLLFLVLGIVLWTIRIIADIIQFRADKIFVTANAFLLLIPYGPVAGYLGYKGMLEIKWFYQRERVTTTVELYGSINLPDSGYFRNYEFRNDSILLYATSNKRQDYLKRGKAFSFKNISNSHHGFINLLQQYHLTDNHLTRVNNPIFDIDSLTLKNTYIISTNTPAPKIWHGSPQGNHYILIGDTSDSYKSDTLLGYSEDSRNAHLQGQVSCTDKDGVTWFTFFTESVREAPTKIFVCKNAATKKVFKLKLNIADREWFDTGRIVGMFRNGKTIYILSIKKIIYFDVE